MINVGFYVVMTAMSTFETLSILKRVQKGEKLRITKKRSIFHAIVLPVFMEDDTILEQSLNYLAAHQRAQQNYLIFLAFEEKADQPRERA
jgi:ribosomal protein L1